MCYVARVNDMNLDALRAKYEQHGLSEADLGSDPIASFERWLDDATRAQIHEPSAMTLATISPRGPTSRVVLLRGVDARGFVFYTNYESDKSIDIEADARVALCFAWVDLARQVRIEGKASRVAREETDAYFRSRPRGSQLGAWASPQSRPVSREELDARYAALEREYAGKDVPAPPHWGGFRVTPSRIEFWQGRPSRMHDRIRFDLDGSRWRIERLAP
jgi:pyridoxamine 5'-phosphate oxidase